MDAERTGLPPAVIARYVDPAIARRRLGDELRRLRDDAQLTQLEVAPALEWSHSKLVRIENGAGTISGSDLQALLDIYGATDQLPAFNALARAGQRQYGRDDIEAARLRGEYLGDLGLKFWPERAVVSEPRRVPSRVFDDAMPPIPPTPDLIVGLVRFDPATHVFAWDHATGPVRISRSRRSLIAIRMRHRFVPSLPHPPNRTLHDAASPPGRIVVSTPHVTRGPNHSHLIRHVRGRARGRTALG
jgi:transcriptional regulator with XRE-family HTH domain